MSKFNLKPWENHVTKANGISWCGVKIVGLNFINKEHALQSINKNTYAQPCKECIKAIENSGN